MNMPGFGANFSLRNPVSASCSEARSAENPVGVSPALRALDSPNARARNRCMFGCDVYWNACSFFPWPKQAYCDEARNECYITCRIEYPPIDD